jgi:hypothetical protein
LSTKIPQYLSASLSRTLRQTFDTDRASLRYCQASFTREILRVSTAIMSEPPESLWLRQVSQQSHVHGTGFYKLLLGDTLCDRFRIRLHLWPQQMHGQSPLNIHDHRYDFVSAILAGEMTNVVWQLDRNGQQRQKYIYSPRVGGRYGMRRKGVETLSVSESVRLSAGEIYRCDAAQLHFTEPSAHGDVVSVFAEDRSRLRPTSTTYVPLDQSYAAKVAVPGLSPDRFRSILSQAVALVSPGPVAA